MTGAAHDPRTLVLVLVAVLVGSVLQRLSGTGMGLVLAPILTLVLGAASGVLVANATTTVSGFLMMLALWRAVDWAKARVICACAVPGAIAGGWVVRTAPAAWLLVVVGGVVLLAIGVTVVAGALGRMPELRGRWVTPVAGLVGGLFNTTAGVAAPVMVVHSHLTRWDHRSFAATMQPVFMTMGAVSVTVKLAMGAAGVALPPWWVVPAVVATVVVGIAAGGRLARRVPASTARGVAITLAGLGGLGALVRGLIALLSP